MINHFSNPNAPKKTSFMEAYKFLSCVIAIAENDTVLRIKDESLQLSSPFDLGITSPFVDLGSSSEFMKTLKTTRLAKTILGERWQREISLTFQKIDRFDRNFIPKMIDFLENVPADIANKPFAMKLHLIGPYEKDPYKIVYEMSFLIEE